MRNDSAAAIALNRSGFHGGSLDWDFDGRQSGADEMEPPEVMVVPAPSKPITLPPLSSHHSTSANMADRSSMASGSGNAPAAAAAPGDGSPDSAEYVANDAVVVYNERTAL